jgi:hypothetical protein
LPTAFEARIWNEYAVPFVRPATVAVVPVTVNTADGETGETVTEYPVIALPPFEEGAVQERVAAVLPATAVTPVEAPGTSGVVTGAEGKDAGPVPAAFAAVTANV